MTENFAEGIYRVNVTRMHHDPYTKAEIYSVAPELIWAPDADYLEDNSFASVPEFAAEVGTKSVIIYDHAASTAYVTDEAHLEDDALALLGPDETAWTDDEGNTHTWREEFEDMDDMKLLDVMGNLDMPIVTIDTTMSQTRGVEAVKVLR